MKCGLALFAAVSVPLLFSHPAVGAEAPSVYVRNYYGTAVDLYVDGNLACTAPAAKPSHGYCTGDTSSGKHSVMARIQGLNDQTVDVTVKSDVDGVPATAHCEVSSAGVFSCDP